MMTSIVTFLSSHPRVGHKQRYESVPHDHPPGVSSALDERNQQDSARRQVGRWTESSTIPTVECCCFWSRLLVPDVHTQQCPLLIYPPPSPAQGPVPPQRHHLAHRSPDPHRAGDWGTRGLAQGVGVQDAHRSGRWPHRWEHDRLITGVTREEHNYRCCMGYRVTGKRSDARQSGG